MGADRVQAGPINSAGTNPFDTQALILDTENNVLETSGTSHARAVLQAVLLCLGAQTALSAITTAQDLFTLAFNAGLLNVTNRTLRIRGFLIYTSPGTSTPTISIALTLGGVTLCTITTAAISATASTNMPVQFEFTLTVATTGASATIECHGKVVANISANTPAAAGAEYLDTNTAVSSAVNLVTAPTLACTIAASGTVTSAQLRQATVEIVA